MMPAPNAAGYRTASWAANKVEPGRAMVTTQRLWGRLKSAP